MKLWTILPIAVITIGVLVPSVAFAGVQGRKNTATVLTGAAALSWLSGHHTGQSVLLTGAAAVAWNQEHKAAVKARSHRLTHYRKGYYYSKGHYYKRTH